MAVQKYSNGSEVYYDGRDKDSPLGEGIYTVDHWDEFSDLYYITAGVIVGEDYVPREYLSRVKEGDLCNI